MNLRKSITIALMGVLSFIIMFLEIPLPIFPEFLKIDLSDIPAIIVGFAFGPFAGVAVELLKNVLHLMRTTTSGVGELANFLVGSAIVIPAAFIYRKRSTLPAMIGGLVIGTLVMAVVGGIANYYILIPFYQNFMPIDAIIGMAAAVNSKVVDLKTLILYAIVPFNLLKGIVVSILTVLVYKKVATVINKNIADQKHIQSSGR
jgi:riboflavin transporter FmnP